MKKKKNVAKYILIGIVFIWGCTKESDKRDCFNNLKHIKTIEDKTIGTIAIDTLMFDFRLSSSSEGFWRIKDNSYFYFDKVLGVVNEFNDKGEFVKRSLGLGKGPGEVLEEVADACPYDEGWLTTEVYNIYRFSNTFEEKRMKFLFDATFAGYEKVKKEILKNPKPSEDIFVYVPAYDYPQLIHKSGDKFIMKVSCEYPDNDERKYFEESAIVAEYDFGKGSITKLYGGYPPCYLKYESLPAFAFQYFTPYKKDRYIVSYAIDSLMYVCDGNFNPINSFGMAGAIVNDRYVSKKERQAISNYDYFEERGEKGYYTSVFYCKDKDLLFRVYKTGLKEIADGESENPTRMQVYKGNVLIGDVSVPDKFEIIAYKNPYFYCDGYIEVGEDFDKIGMYRFKLEL